MKFGKRQLVIASLVVALGTAVYLNWQFSENSAINIVDDSENNYKKIGQTTYVNTEINNPKIGELSSLSESSTSKFTDTTKAVNMPFTSNN